MNLNETAASWRGTCLGCGERFTEWAWTLRHEISDDEGRTRSLDPGDYHDKCCPLPDCCFVSEAVAS